MQGLCIHWIYQAVVICTASYGLAATDFFYATPIVHSFMMAELIRDEVGQLNEHLLQPKIDMVATKVKFRNILLMHQEMAEYERHDCHFCQFKLLIKFQYF